MTRRSIFDRALANIVRSASVSVTGSSMTLRLVGTWIPGPGISEAFPDGAREGGPRWRDSCTLRRALQKDVARRRHPGRGSKRASWRSTLPHDERGSPMETAAVTVGRSPHAVDRGSRSLIALLPRLDDRVETLTAELVLPDGGREPILRLYQPDPGWPQHLLARRTSCHSERESHRAGSRERKPRRRPRPAILTVLLDSHHARALMEPEPPFGIA